MASIRKSLCAAWNCASFTFAVIFLYSLLCAPTQAQSMYRCGTVYQDRPCDGTQPGKVIGSTGASQPSASPNVDPVCARRGAVAQKLVWAREGGMTEDRAVKEARSQEEMTLISTVYHNRGTSSEVRTAVESDCNQEKVRAAQAATMMDAAKLLDPTMSGPGKPPARTSSSSTRTSTNESPSRLTTNNTAANDSASNDAARKKRDCEYLRSQLDEITSHQRIGGGAAEMEGMNQQRRALNEGMIRSGC